MVWGQPGQHGLIQPTLQKPIHFNLKVSNLLVDNNHQDQQGGQLEFDGSAATKLHRTPWSLSSSMTELSCRVVKISRKEFDQQHSIESAELLRAHWIQTTDSSLAAECLCTLDLIKFKCILNMNFLNFIDTHFSNLTPPQD